MPNIALNIENVLPFLKAKKPFNLQKEISRIHERMEKEKGPGSDFLGWRRLPSHMSRDHLNKINETAKFVQDQADVFISIGIGGSYLGAKAAIEFANHYFVLISFAQQKILCYA